MEFDQKIFKWFWKLGQKLFKAAPQEPVVLPVSQQALQLFASLIFGRSVELYSIPAEADQIHSNQDGYIYLPLEQTLLGQADLNLDFLKLRILLIAAGEKNLAATTLVRLRNLSKVLPGVPSLYHQVARAIQNYENQDPPGPLPRVNLRQILFVYDTYSSSSASINHEANPSELTPDGDGAKQQIEVELKMDPNSELLAADKKKIEDYTLSHNFEKLETLDDFSGSWRDLDNEDNPQELEDALKELQFAHRIRTAETPKAVISGTSPQGTAAEAADADLAESCLTYNEWDFKKKKYKIDFCRVFEKQLKGHRPKFIKHILDQNSVLYRRVEAHFEKALFERRRVLLSTTGDFPDIDRLVAAQTDRRCGRTPDERLYQIMGKRPKELIIWFLIDNSLSTDAWIRGQRVLDAILTSVTLCAAVLTKHAIDFGVSFFHSRTRNDCRHNIIKRPSQAWSQVGDRLGAIEPAGYTRIGPALRRTTDLLAGHRASKRWLLLFSDARPNDYDRYEGAYGLADVRQAVRESEGRGIHTHGFGIRAESQGSMDMLLGRGRGQLLHRPADLPEALVSFAGRLFA